MQEILPLGGNAFLLPHDSNPRVRKYLTERTRQLTEWVESRSVASLQLDLELDFGWHHPRLNPNIDNTTWRKMVESPGIEWFCLAATVGKETYLGCQLGTIYAKSATLFEWDAGFFSLNNSGVAPSRKEAEQAVFRHIAESIHTVLKP